MTNLPYFAVGEIVKGFGRGSKQLGVPTANYPPSVVNLLPSDLENGVYYGFASVNKGDIYKMVMSIGWNPFYNNTERSMETHILHKFNRDLYGEELRICILDYIRPERDFNSVEDLVKAINSDIDYADKNLNCSEYDLYRNHSFFKK
ncbi:hypothetical protein PPYR_09722 [Photinus pyralis]|uniref:Riboflavin kinase n=1 Tax=Photinus pyralis TaxID=7054 RepID=A0A1Y1LG48_PHOPY|nr:hypothetical protein PPYR_09722 [Photinus pyralis]